MAICSENKETISLTNCTDSYFTRSTPNWSCLPNNGAGWTSASDLDSAGNVSSAALNAWMPSLLASVSGSNPPSVITNGVNAQPQGSTFATAAASLRNKIYTEYCFYYVRYQFILASLLNDAISLTSAQVNGTPFQTKKASTQLINMKLNQIIQVLQSLMKSRALSLEKFYGAGAGSVNQLNTHLTQVSTSLQNHSRLLSKNNLTQDIQASMIEYTKEKNASSTNLLAIYGFMNIVAVGLLFYLYRSSK
jgi:hypothetical protein